MSRAEFDFPKLVRDRITELKTTPYAVEQAHDLPPDAIRNIIRNAAKPKRSLKSDGPTLSRALEITRALGLELWIGPPREPADPLQLRIDEGEFLAIPERAAQLAAGTGAINDADCVIGHLAFRKEWLSRHGILAEKATLVHVRGNSMAPGILDGDLVLIDTRDRDIPVRKPKSQKTLPIFAFVEDGEARVKRIARPSEDQVLILSDNPEFLPEVISGPRLRTLKIIGRVRWWGHTVED